MRGERGESMTLEEIVRRVECIDRQIDALMEVREIVLRQDADYAEYLDEFMARGVGIPLDIREYHQLSDEFVQLNLRFFSPNVYHRRLMELEDLLLA
jgi:hypothetical protein